MSLVNFELTNLTEQGIQLSPHVFRHIYDGLAGVAGREWNHPLEFLQRSHQGLGNVGYGAVLVSLHPHVFLLVPVDVTEQVGGRAVVLAPPGVNVVDGLGVLTQVQEAAQNQVVGVFRADLKNFKD